MFWNMEKNFSECTEFCGLKAKQVKLVCEQMVCRYYSGIDSGYESPGVYIKGQRIFVEKARNVFVMGEAFSI